MITGKKALATTAAIALGVACTIAVALANPRAARAGGPAISFFGLGTPTATTVVSGNNFDPNAAFEVYFDSADVASGVTAPDGTFGGVGIDVPVTAVPGSHWVTVTETATGLSAQASYFVSSPWAQFHSAAGLTGLNPYENVISSLNASTLVSAWTGNTPAGVRSSAAVGSLGFAYVGSDDGTVYSFPPGCHATCPPKWTATTGGPVTSSPALGSGAVYVGSGDGKLYAFPTGCTNTCNPAWTASTGGAVTSPTVSGNVFVGSGDDKVYAFKPSCGASTCSPLWAKPTGGPITGAPAVAFGKVYVGSGDAKVYALSPSNGAISWRVAVNGPVVASVAVAQQPWSQPVVYAVTQPGTLYALNAYTGAIQWRGSLGAPSTSSPAVAYGNVFVGTDRGKLAAFGANGCTSSTCAPLWIRATGGAVTTAPAVGNGVVFVGSKGGSLLAFNSRSGTPLWTSSLGSAVESSPAVANSFVYVGADAGGPPIRHVVIIYQENHSFDDTLGFLCVRDQRCDGATTGTLPDGSTVQLAQEPDLVPIVEHDVASQVAAVDGGKMDGFSLIDGCSQTDNYACYAQYQPGQIPNLAALARAFVISDRTFESDSVPSWGGHIDVAAAQVDGFIGDNPLAAPGLPVGPLTWGCDSNDNALWAPPGGSVQSIAACIPKQDGSGPYAPSPASWIPTIMDRLDAAGSSWRIYGGWGTWTVCPSFADCIYGPQRNAAVTYDQVLADAASGSLANVSIVIPTGANSQHNGWSMLQGDNWIGSVVGAIEQGPEWQSTAIFITYDDCGCFYDHVAPPQGLGIRVPMVIVSPYAKAGYTDSNVASYSSMLAYVEGVFGLAPLYSTDANAYDFGQSFDYTQHPLATIPLKRHPVPAWERGFLRAHPPKQDAT